MERLGALAGAGPVLELGVGTGRLAVPLAARMPPAAVWGIDTSAAMLERLAANDPSRSVQAHPADMAILDLPPSAPSSFSLIFAAFNTFYLLPGAAAQRRCLRRCRELLRPEGRLVLEAYRRAAIAPGIDPPPERLAAVGRQVEIAYRCDGRQPGAFRGVAHIDGVETPAWSMHPLTSAEMDSMVASAGFVLASRHGSWSATPYFESVGHHVSVWQPA